MVSQKLSKELLKLYPTKKHMYASHETIYTNLYLLSKEKLRKELTGYLRQKNLYKKT